MPTLDVEENINKLRVNIEQMTQEVFRLQGMLQTFEGFKKGGLRQLTFQTTLIRNPSRNSRVSKRSPNKYQHSKPL